MQKACAICGDLFTLESNSQRICKKDHYQPCPICGKSMIWNSTRKIEPCSKECRKIQTKQRNLAKYGVEHPMQSKDVQNRHKQSMMDKYGVEHPMQSEEIKIKAIESNRKKFGTDWALSNKEVKKKAKATMLEKYGAATTLESSVLRKKVEQTCLEKYGVKNPLQNSNIQDRITNTNFLKCRFSNPMQNIEVNVEDYGDYLLRNVEHRVVPNINKAFMEQLKKRGIEGEFEFTGISHFRYDIVVESQKTLIEIDPTYTHNVIGNYWSAEGLPSDYHKIKSEAAQEAGYQCIHVFDWDDWDKVINLLLPRTPVYARDCVIYKIQPKVAEQFLNSYHLQGSVKGQVLCLGLVRNSELLQVMTFGSPRYNKNYYSELLRLCSKPGIRVIGGASKLFNFATKKLGVNEIVSYCDLSKFNGTVYNQIGMKFVRKTEPQEIWSRNSDKITANLLRQRGFDQLFGTSYGKGTSNTELMLNDGWLPVYDCGQAVFEYREDFT